MLVGTLLGASKTEYCLKSLGLKIAYLSIEKNDTQKQITVKTHSLMTNSIFPPLNNEYRISYDEQYRPQTLTRIIRQKNLNDIVETRYDHSKQIARQSRKSDINSIDYSIGKQTRDIFSFLAFLAGKKPESGTYPIDGNGNPWLATAVAKPSETLKTVIGKHQARKIDVSFTNVTEQKQPYVDMVTNNILKEGNKLSLWVDDRQQILKAVVKSKDITTYWELTKLTP